MSYLLWGGGKIFAAYSVCNPLLDNVIYVDQANEDSEDGSASNPYDTIQEGIDNSVGGQCIWVKEGTYNECIEFDSGSSPANGISIYGGFPSNSFDWDDRDPASNETIIQGTSTCSYVVDIDTESWCKLVGFVIEVNSRNYQTGVRVYNSEDIVIASNQVRKCDTDIGKNAIDVTSTEDIEISGNQITADMSDTNTGWLNGILYTYGGGTWDIEENIVAYCNTHSTESCGIVTNGMDSNGTISDNRVTYSSIGISCLEENSESGDVKVENNRIGFCDYGIKQRFGMYDSQMTVVQYNWVYESDEVGIEIEYPSLVESNSVWDSEVGIEDKHSSGTVNIYENTVWRCGSYGFYLHSSSTTNMYNNISVYNDYGIKGTSTYANCDYNCVCQSLTDDYDPDSFEGLNDVSTAPIFRSPPFSYVWYLHWRFYQKQNPPQTSAPYSPCVNAGNGKTPYGTTRSDHVVDSGAIDIGAHLLLN